MRKQTPTLSLKEFTYISRAIQDKKGAMTPGGWVEQWMMGEGA